jgi:RNA 2',3'-cyclic 3'-phosphodiesterase
MRLFLAFPVPELPFLWGANTQGFTPTIAPDLHLTLRFIGDVPQNIAYEIAQELTSLPFTPFEINLTGYGYLGGNKPYSLHILAQQTPVLMQFQKSVERLLQRLGLPPETRQYTPHVTLAQLKNISEATLVLLCAEQPAFAPIKFTLSHFNLYASKDLHGGGPYAIVARYDT